MWRLRSTALRPARRPAGGGGAAAALPWCATRSIADKVNGVAATVQFKRFWRAPTMEPDEVVRTFQELVAERSSDALLLRALTQRFSANADEFFPPQIAEVVDACAVLHYADDSLQRGVAGRLADLASDASPRRLVRLLKNGAVLRLDPEAFLQPMLLPLRAVLPDLGRAVPAVLGSLSTLRLRDPELVNLLLTQGLLVREKQGDAYFTKLFERWSRHGAQNKEADQAALALVNSDALSKMDLRDNLNMLAGLKRRPGKPQGEALQALEAALEKRLQKSGLAGDAFVCIEWMERLSLRSPRLWRTCAETLEVVVKDRGLSKEIPAALHGLASLAEGQDEAELVAALVKVAAEAHGRHTASQALQLLRAACLLRAASAAAPGGQVSAIDWPALLDRAARGARRLTLPERRALREAAESLQDLADGAGDVAESLNAIRDLPVVPLPPLLEEGSEAWSVADVGPEALLVATPDEESHGVRFLGFRDTFAAPVSKKRDGPPATTPSCKLTVKSLAAHGWKVQLRA